MTNSIHFKSTAIRLKRPPLARVLFDVHVQNASDTSRWFLIRDQLDASWQLESTTANGIEAFELRGEGRVVLAHFDGNHNFLAVLLPGRGIIVLHGLALSLWNTTNSSVATARVVIADELTIDKQSVSDWLGLDLKSDIRATVSTGNAKALAERYTPARHELPIGTQSAMMTEIRVDIPSTKL